MSTLHDIGKLGAEYRAKNTLVALFPDEFDGLEKSERPDWVDYENRIGMEVVQAIDGKYLEEKKHFSNKIAWKKLDDLLPEEKRSIKRYQGRIFTEKELGISNDSTAASHSYTMYGETAKLYDAVKKKLALINKEQNGYQKLHHIFLYVLCDTAVTYDDVRELFKFIHAEQERYCERFSGVFIDDGYALYQYRSDDGFITYHMLFDIAQEVYVKTKSEIRDYQ